MGHQEWVKRDSATARRPRPARPGAINRPRTFLVHPGRRTNGLRPRRPRTGTSNSRAESSLGCRPNRGRILSEHWFTNRLLPIILHCGPRVHDWEAVMTRHTRTLPAVAADLRAVGHSWPGGVDRGQPKPESCRKYPAGFRSQLEPPMPSHSERTRRGAVEAWLKSKAADCGPTTTPARGFAAPEENLLAGVRQEVLDARARINRLRALLGLPGPATRNLSPPRPGNRQPRRPGPGLFVSPRRSGAARPSRPAGSRSAASP